MSNTSFGSLRWSLKIVFLLCRYSMTFVLYLSVSFCAPPAQNRPFPHPHLITVNHSLPNVWSDFLEPEAEPMTAEHRQAIALMHCFASAVAHAHHLGYSLGSDLPTPICLDAVCSDGVWFDFVCFQLNTLRVPDIKRSNCSLDYVRNVAWIDGSRRLFDKIVPTRSQLRNTKYRDLDMQVFSRLATSYLWGLVGHHVELQHTQSNPVRTLEAVDWITKQRSTVGWNTLISYSRCALSLEFLLSRQSKG